MLVNTEILKEDLNNESHMVDFVKIRFNSDPAESSVAGGDSGFTERFNEPHFFNAVRIDSPTESASTSTENWPKKIGSM